MRKRTKAREWALKILYQAEVTQNTISVSTENFLQDQENQDEDIHKFTRRLISTVDKQIKKIDEYIKKYAANWELKRMAFIDRNILRLGVAELMFMPDIPPKVTINEGVELGKKYGDIESGKFINGILDKIHKEEVLSKSKSS